LDANGPQDKKAIADFLITTIGWGVPPFLRCADDPQAAAYWRPILEHSGRSLELAIANARVVATEVRRQLAMRPELLRPHRPVEEE